MPLRWTRRHNGIERKKMGKSSGKRTRTLYSSQETEKMLKDIYVYRFRKTSKLPSISEIFSDAIKVLWNKERHASKSFESFSQDPFE
jgi:hypothetical protein